MRSQQMVRMAGHDSLDSFAPNERAAGITFSLSLRSKCAGLLMMAGVVWLAIIGAGTLLMLLHSQQPGPDGAAPQRWPESSPVHFDTGTPTIVMFLHPHCPCTRATVGELERLMAHFQGQVHAHVWFIRPPGVTEAWVKTDLWQSAEAIPGVTVHGDEDGAIARMFHAETSGQTDLYDRHGRLLFQGGITVSRGHAGDNAGRSAIAALLAHQPFSGTRTPVFGCSLSESESKPREGESPWKR